ncbi:HigA family addiction module antidote protein [Rhizobium rhizogenes]|jgi:addiction module HigA family antidote|uniref:HigA family addiction module antitoxin n=1 Tax=Rhizobium rhizogenes TaxID=359 RepID=UPI001571F2D9|nr:HigA family addiction module antitoxin [Rhizobium rhizogenes]NTG00183.1 HigA family addiction module antidote protein [Rhizobium rhizogenes]NTI22060.1 HigA family addiction module antidote protein [Rhizobium rhizogenes]NTI74258.1 HigA family addiction module antidote protein [Rhizobium rhizogenes]QTG05661.1 HigA family addiction module antidote protein [Rhizobium rhizogenes]
MTREIPIPHPGEVLKEEFFDPMGISVYAAAKAMHVPRSQLNDICRGELRITASIALRLGKYLDVDPRWFMNMQAKYDLDESTEQLADELEAIEPVKHAA